MEGRQVRLHVSGRVYGKTVGIPGHDGDNGGEKVGGHVDRGGVGVSKGREGRGGKGRGWGQEVCIRILGCALWGEEGS